jgi:hypothetical protein
LPSTWSLSFRIPNHHSALHLLSPYMPHAPSISFYVILSPEQHLVQHANDEAPPDCNFLLYPVTSSSLALNTSLSTPHSSAHFKLHVLT